jgi:hypothetical protein
LAAFLLVLLLAHAARVALVRSTGELQPERALAVWPGHPVPLFSTALIGIGTAARQGKPPEAGLLALVERGALQAPMAPEPLWVAATARLEAGDLQAAEQMLRLAVRLDARAPASRFLLADLAIRQGRLDEALTQIAALQRRMPGVSAGFAPALARYLQQPGTVDQVAPLLLRDPPLRETVLQGLAADPAATGQLIALSRPGDERSPWFGTAVQQLLANGDIGLARTLFGRVLPGAPLGRTLTAWRTEPSSNPFEWRFPSSGGGLAEPVAGGPLRIVHYGRENSPLAEHLLMLPPGRYRLVDRFNGSVPERAFEWSLQCLKGGRQLGMVPAGRSGQAATLSIPGDCPVQRLVLVGKAGDIAATVRAELRSVTLEAGGAG